MKTGTLEELNVKPGDVVAWRGGQYIAFDKPAPKSDVWAGNLNDGWISGNAENCIIISRAAPDPLPHGHVTLPDGRTVDLTANRVRCDLMDPDELQAMKDHGGPYEVRCAGLWGIIKMPAWSFNATYRVAPKPVVETVVMYGNVRSFNTIYQRQVDTHSITLTIQDGKIIDTKTEEL